MACVVEHALVRLDATRRMQRMVPYVPYVLCEMQETVM